MSAGNLIDGRAIAEQIHQETARRVTTLKARGVEPRLVFIRVGEDPASRDYVGRKEKSCARAGISSQTHVLPQTSSEAALLDLILRLNTDATVHGILVQAPLPRHISETKIYGSVAPEKDVDGFHPLNVGKLLLGDTSGFRSCTPAGIQELLVRSDVKIEGAEVVILGRSNIVGKPLAAILLQKERNSGATVTVCHSQTRDAAAHCRRADILVAAVGVAQFVKAEMVKPGAVVIDVGVTRVPDASAKSGTRVVGDVDFAGVQPIAGKITPNPGGVGPMTVAMLLQNTVQAAEQMSQASHT
jgi:methylenetetrahydrofolate dehydrogenase (NADP+)/methenyltetrahydrofolate cyclohydrolase